MSKDFDKQLENKLLEYLVTNSITKAAIPVVANYLGISIPELQEALSSSSLQRRLQQAASSQALLYSIPTLNILAQKTVDGDVKAASTILNYSSATQQQEAPVIRLSVEGLKDNV